MTSITTIKNYLSAFIICVMELFVLLATKVHAREVTVKYDGQIPLDQFECSETNSSFIYEICYDQDNLYLVVDVGGTYYGYCEIDPVVVENFRSAPSAGKFFNKHIEYQLCHPERPPVYD